MGRGERHGRSSSPLLGARGSDRGRGGGGLRSGLPRCPPGAAARRRRRRGRAGQGGGRRRRRLVARRPARRRPRRQAARRDRARALPWCAHAVAGQLRLARRDRRSVLRRPLHLLRSRPRARAAAAEVRRPHAHARPLQHEALIGGAANQPGRQALRVTVVRDVTGHIAGFAGTAAPYADAPYNDGGVAYAPSGVLLIARYPNNEIQQTKPGSTRVDKLVPLGQPGGLQVAHSSAASTSSPRTCPAAAR